MDRYTLEKLARLSKTGVFSISKTGEIAVFQSDSEQNPLFQSLSMRQRLMQEADEMDLPRIYRDEFHIFYACIKTEDSYILLGPMATEYLNRARRHDFFRKMNVSLDLEKNLHLFSMDEILQTVSLFAKLLKNLECSDQELIDANHLVTESREKLDHDEIRYDLKTEDTEESYRHSYQEERQLLSAVRDGNIQEALKRNKEMDEEIGKLSTDDTTHWRNVLVIGATLCARAAIEGGVAPYIAYRISGYYINKGSNSKDALQILSYRNQAVEELTQAVHEQKLKRHTSSYTQQCKDYVRKHFREKIYLDEIAQQLGISSSYLSRLFKKEVGTNLQDYVVDIRVERAANLLIYSEEPIPRIAEYVNFPSQSYFGRIFKEKKHMTPREYREAYKPAEFISKRLQ